MMAQLGTRQSSTTRLPRRPRPVEHALHEYICRRSIRHGGCSEIHICSSSDFNEILLDIRHPGKPVVIEGQSGTGKTTCVKKILEQLGSPNQIHYLTARERTDVSKIKEIVTQMPSGIFVVDDFHRLEENLQEATANLAKMSAEQASGIAVLPKLVLIGINQVGSDLIQLVPDIAKRTGIHRIKPGTEEEIRKLIEAGCERLNIKIDGRDLIFGESKGDYWLTQQLCQSICTMNDVLQTSDNLRSIIFDLSMANCYFAELHGMQHCYIPFFR
jgi:Holliday junction resolvasome RuvABC ATP-dependent DNA helicase subunit